MESQNASRALITIAELSRRLAVAKGTLYNFVSKRRIPFVKIGSCLRFDFEKVFQSLKQCPKADDPARH